MSQDMELLRSDQAIIARRHIAGEMGGADVYCVVLADGFLLECGTGAFAEERAQKLAAVINASDPGIFALHPGRYNRNGEAS